MAHTNHTFPPFSIALHIVAGNFDDPFPFPFPPFAVAPPWQLWGCTREMGGGGGGGGGRERWMGSV